MVLVNGFAAAYLWDATFGYPEDNARVLAHSLGLGLEHLPVINQKLTADYARRLIEDWHAGMDASAVKSRLGEASITHGGDWYYLGPGGSLRVRLGRGRVEHVEWTTGKHSETDLAWQERIGYGLLLAGVVLLVHFVRVVTTGVTVTSEGFKIRGKPLIPFGAITALRLGGSAKDVKVVMEYSAGGRQRTLKLDDYRIKRVRAVVAAICEHTRLPNPYDGPDRAPPNSGETDQDEDA
jgi:hypothetical protein